MAAAQDLYLTTTINCVFNVFLSYTAIVLNITAIYALRKTSSLPKPLKTLLLSLAVSDLGVGLLVQPLYIALLVVLMNQDIEYFENFKNTTEAFIIIGTFLFYASFFGVTALSADRFLAVHLHLRYQELVTQKRVVAVVVSIWVFSAFLSLTNLSWIPTSVGNIIFVTIGFTCLIITALFYVKLYLVVRSHTNQIHALQGQSTLQNEMANSARLRKSAVGPFYVYLVFLVCNLPNICIYVAILTTGQSTLIMHLSRYALTLVFLNSSLNPLIYCWKMRHIRHTVMEILQNIFPSHN